MRNLEISVPNVNIYPKETMQEASQAAAEEAGNTGGFHCPGILFKQGQRYCISTAIPVRRVRSRLLLEVNAARPKGTVADVKAATNRPLMPDHVSNIAQYLKENVGERYILPPMTLNVQQPISVYMPQYASAGFGAVYTVIPETARLSVTDGGHRTSGIIKAASEMNQDDLAAFDQDAVAVMITLEGDLVQVHQDFADCSKTKPLPKSQLAAYDRRNPANGLVLDLIDRCRLFDDKIDSTSKTLSKTSVNLFLTNHVRQLVKELLIGDYALTDDKFEAKAKELLGNNESVQYKADLEQYAAYIDRFTEGLPILREIAALPPGTPRNIIKERRSEGWICLTATGMVILGRIGHELFRDQVVNWLDYTDRLGALDWSRASELWQGNIVRLGRLTTQRGPVRIAVEKVRRAIDLQPNHKLDEELGEPTPSRADALVMESA